MGADISNSTAPQHHQESRCWAVTVAEQLKASPGSILSYLPASCRKDQDFPSCLPTGSQKWPFPPETSVRLSACFVFCRKGRILAPDWRGTGMVCGFTEHQTPDSDASIFVSAKVIIGFGCLRQSLIYCSHFSSVRNTNCALFTSKGTKAVWAAFKYCHIIHWEQTWPRATKSQGYVRKFTSAWEVKVSHVTISVMWQLWAVEQLTEPISWCVRWGYR